MMVLPCLVMELLLLAPAWGEDINKVASKPSEKAVLVFDASKETSALDFARRHHSELAEVLITLRGMNRGEYEKTIVELWQKREQLDTLKRRDPASHDISLEEWKIQSRITLLVARLRLMDDEQSLAELRKLLNQRIDLRIKRRALERDRAAAQVQRAEAAIEKLNADREASVNAELKRLVREKPGKRSKPPKKTSVPNKDKP